MNCKDDHEMSLFHTGSLSTRNRYTSFLSDITKIKHVCTDRPGRSSDWSSRSGRLVAAMTNTLAVVLAVLRLSSSVSS